MSTKNRRESVSKSNVGLIRVAVQVYIWVTSGEQVGMGRDRKQTANYEEDRFMPREGLKPVIWIFGWPNIIHNKYNCTDNFV